MMKIDKLFLCAAVIANLSYNALAKDSKQKEVGKLNYDCGLTKGLDAAVSAGVVALYNYNHENSDAGRLVGRYEGVANAMVSAGVWLTEFEPESKIVKAALKGVSATLETTQQKGKKSGGQDYWLSEINRLKQVSYAAEKQMIEIVRQTCDEPDYRNDLDGVSQP